MKKNNNFFFPLSSKGILNYGLENWINSNNFKINYSKNIRLTRKRIIESYKEIFFDKNDKDLEYAAISNYDLLDVILYLSQFYEILEILKKKKIKNVYFDKKTIINNTYIARVIFKKYLDNSFLNFNDVKPTYKIFFKNFISYIESFIFGKKKIIIIYDNKYIKKLFPRKKYTYFYFNFRKKEIIVDYEAEKNIEKKVNFFFRNVFKKNLIKIPKSIVKKTSSNFYQCYSFLKKSEIKPPNYSFVPNMLGKSKLRAFAIKSLLNKINIHGYIHGNQILNFEISEESFFYNGQLSLGGECSVGSISEKKRIKRCAKNFTKPIKKLNFKISKNLYQKKIVTCNSKNKTILLMGFPMSQDFYYWAPSFHSFNILRIEAHIIKLCNKYKYKIDYKIHPERINEVDKLYRKEKVNIIYEPLENILNKYEYVICPHPISTTFSYILYSSNAKVILFNHKDLKWDRSIFNYLLKRAEIVDLYNDANNVMKFNDKRLLNCIKTVMSKNYKKNNYKIIL